MVPGNLVAVASLVTLQPMSFACYSLKRLDTSANGIYGI